MRIIIAVVIFSYGTFVLSAGFSPGGKSVILKNPESVSRKTPAVNRIVNGSFEEPGTLPDGWLQEKQKGWCGFFNIPRWNTPEEETWYKKIRNSSVRKIVPNGAEGNVALAIVTPDSLQIAGKKFPQVSNKVFQIVTIPKVPDDGMRYTLRLKVRGTPGRLITIFVKSMQAQADGKNKGLAPSVIRNFPLTSEWREVSLTFDAKAGADRIDVTLALYGCGELFADSVSLFSAAEEDPVTVASLPAALVDGVAAWGEKLPGMLTFVFDHGGKIERKALRLAVEIPAGWKYVDARESTGLLKNEGNIYYFDLMRYTDKQLRDHYQYQAAAVMLASDLPASDRLHELRYWLVDGNWKGKVHSMNLKIIPSFSGKKPARFKTSAMFGHEVEFGSAGTAGLLEFYRTTGFNCVNGSAHNPALAAGMKKLGYERFDEVYDLANGYRLGRKPKTGQARFIKIDGTPYPNKVCPVEVYQKGEYFHSAIKPLIENYILTRDLSDSLMPNWEPYYLDSKGCFCDRCREEFILYCKGTPDAETLRADWPKEILKKYFDRWQKFRSFQHGRLMATLEKTVAEAGKKAGKESHFIPEITFASVLAPRHHLNAQYGVLDYAWELPWLEPWGPYFWHSLNEFNEHFPAVHLALYMQAGEALKFLRSKAPRGAEIPRLIAFPHGWQDSFLVSTPEEIAMDMISFFIQKWNGAFLYYFPRGYDYRYWRAVAIANDRIARAEPFLEKGQSIDSKVTLEALTGLPSLFFPVKWDEVPGETPLVPGLSKASPIQFRAFELAGDILVAVGNFWENGEHFFRLKIDGLSGKYQVSVPGAVRGNFTAAELKRGIVMQIGALRWQFISIVPAKTGIQIPLFDDRKMEALLQSRRPAIAAALKMEKEHYDRRFGAFDLSVLKPVNADGFSGTVRGELIEIRTPGGEWKVNPGNGGGVISPMKLAAPAFWWTPQGAASLTKPFRVERMESVADGIELELSRKLTPGDKPELSELEIRLRYHFRKDGFRVTAELKNPTADSLAFSFRFCNFPPGERFLFAGRESFERNRQVSFFLTGVPDGELDGICKCERIANVKPGTVGVGGLEFTCSPQPYGFVCWDGAGQKYSTFEPVFPKTILAPGRSVRYSMTVREVKGN